MNVILLIIIGFVSGAIGSLVGLGGGTILVPALLFFGGYTILLSEVSPQIAVGTSLVVMIFTGLSSTLMYMKQKRIDYTSGWLFFIGSGPGGIVGAWINKGLDVKTFSIYFGLFMIFVSLLLMIRGKLKPIEKKKWTGIVRSIKDENGLDVTYGFHPATGISIAFIVGLCSGLFGIGGGSLMVPAMILLFRFPAHTAVATSMFMIFLSAIISSLAHISLGNVDWLFAAALIPGAWFGGRFGAIINQKLQSKTVIVLLRVILIVIGIRLMWQGVS